MTRAADADEGGKVDTALKLYGTGLEAAREGCALAPSLPATGLGPLADTARGQLQDLEAWSAKMAAR